MSDDRAGPSVGAVLDGATGLDVGPDGPDGPARQADTEGHPDDADFTPVSVESLHQVLDGLRQLN